MFIYTVADGGYMDKVLLGKQIKKARKSRKLTAEKLAEMVGVQPTFIRQIESGAALPSLPVFTAMCNALQISPSFLLQGNVEDNELSSCVELMELWQTAAPAHTELISSMLKTALEKVAEL